MDLRRFFSYAMVALSAGLFSVGLQAYAFSQPSTSPPNSDAYAPVNTGGTAQAKTGGLLLNTGGAANGLIVQYGNVGIGATSPGYKLDVAGQVRSSSGGFVFPDGSVQASAAANPSGSYLPLAGGTMSSGSTITFNGDSRYGVGVGSAASNKGSIAVDTLETDPGGTLELNYYGGGAVTIGPSGTKALYTAIIYDGNNTGYFLDPSSYTYINAFQTGGGALLANWPGYNGITQTAGNYIWPGFNDYGGWNQSYYLAGNHSWGLYSNTSLNAQGLYDSGNRVYSAANPPPTGVADGGTFSSGPYTNDWFRVNGGGGIYWQSYGGGWYMQDTTWIRSYNSKPVYMSAGYDSGSPAGAGCGGGLGGGYTFQVCGSLLADIFYDRNNTGYYLDPSNTSYINSFQTGGGSLLANWPGYPQGIQQTDGAYLYPGFLSGQGSGWNTSYYLAGSTSWGLYSNTSLNAQGLYDSGNRVYSAANPPPSATNATNATYSTYINTDSYNMKMHWSGQSGQPTWLWGSNDGANSYVWNPSNFSVNYANSAGYADSANYANSAGNAHTWMTVSCGTASCSTNQCNVVPAGFTFSECSYINGWAYALYYK